MGLTVNLCDFKSSLDKLFYVLSHFFVDKFFMTVKVIARRGLMHFVSVVIFLIVLQVFVYALEKSVSGEKSFDTFSSIRGAREYEELRGVWLSTVGNIDWPIKNGSEEDQKNLLIAYLDKMVQQNMNAVFFQAKPTGGAMYPSKYAPFAAEFTGEEQIENPYNTDFLEFLINEAHARNIEVHVWVNPFRVATHSDRSRLSPKNFGVVYETLDKDGLATEGNQTNSMITYGGRLYLDPGHSIAQDYVIEVVQEILVNYDVDGIHFDDYFYQYKVPGEIWNDENTCRTSKTGRKFDCVREEGTAGKKGLGDWRRDNINRLVGRIQKEIKEIKPYVKWGISPFGVWRNASTPENYSSIFDSEGSRTRAGSTSYDDLYADARLWYRSGSYYVDYLVPQVYWTRHLQAASYDVVTDWWIKEGRRGGVKAALYVGHALYKAGSANNVEPWQDVATMAEQIEFNREETKRNVVAGSVFFTMHDLMDRPGYPNNLVGHKMMNYVRTRLYKNPSLIPVVRAMKDRKAPPPVKNLKADVLSDSAVRLHWQDPSRWKIDRYGHLTSEPARYYVVYRLREGGEVEILKKVWRQAHSYNIEFTDGSAEPGQYTYAVASLDRLHNQSKLMQVSVRVPVLIGLQEYASEIQQE